MQPYKWGGRFYNHKHDSILRRLKNLAGSVCCVLGHHVIRIGQKKTVSVGQPDMTTGALAKPVAQSVQPMITWLGHSTFLIQVAGVNIITDPMFFGRFPLLSRQTPMPVSVQNLPLIDVVLISHNHKDHMDAKSLNILKGHHPLFLVPIGNKKWFARRGFEKVIEKNWWEAEGLPDCPATFTFLPASHWTSRGLFDLNKSLWGSWLIEVDGHKIYFAGDTAYGDHFSAIAQRVGAMDIVLMPIGPNEPRQFIAEAHVNAEEAVRAFIDLKGRHFIPMHWGTFVRMGAERCDDPVSHLERAWEKQRAALAGTMLHVVKCGQARFFDTCSNAARAGREGFKGAQLP